MNIKKSQQTGIVKKESFMLILAAMIVLFSFSGCDSDSSDYKEMPSTSYEGTYEEAPTTSDGGRYEETQPKSITAADALQIAEDYILNSAFGTLRFLSAAKYYVKNTDSISSFSIFSSSISGSDDYYYHLTFKGTFYAHDEFGRNLGKYGYTWKTEVRRDGEDTSILDDDITISK